MTALDKKEPRRLFVTETGCLPAEFPVGSKANRQGRTAKAVAPIAYSLIPKCAAFVILTVQEDLK